MHPVDELIYHEAFEFQSSNFGERGLRSEPSYIGFSVKKEEEMHT
jgi:hypothetical protein